MNWRNTRFKTAVEGFGRAVKTTIDEFPGVQFDSKAEALRAQQLHAMQERGEIRDLEVHPTYRLSDYPRVDVTLDFRYRVPDEITLDEPGGIVGSGVVTWSRVVVEDVKGGLSRDVRVRFSWLLQLWKANGTAHLVTLRVLKRKGNKFVEMDWRGRVGRPGCTRGRCRRAAVEGTAYCLPHQPRE